MTQIGGKLLVFTSLATSTEYERGCQLLQSDLTEIPKTEVGRTDSVAIVANWLTGVIFENIIGPHLAR